MRMRSRVAGFRSITMTRSMLVAQAKVEGLTLVTRDSDIQRYDVDLLVV